MSPARPLLRAARDDDAADIIRIVSDNWAAYPGCVIDIDGEAPELRRLASYAAGRGGAVWVSAVWAGTVEARVVGVACAWPLPDGAWEMAKIYVAQAWHGSGVAHALLDAAEAHARAQGAVRARLWSDTRFDRAHRFYEKRGYVRAGPLRVLDDRSNSIEFAYAKPLAGLVVERLDAAAAASAEAALARVLVACVDAGASVSFFPPMALATARAFWRATASGVAKGEKLLLAAWLDGALVGTVQLHVAMPENQPHRADLAKMLVHPAARRRGVGLAMLARIEAEAGAAGRSLLVLDTLAGDAGETLYRAAGWQECGRIPGYALNAERVPSDTVLFYKTVAAG